MSEYQYYEFRAIDRPLNPREMDELRQLSSRAEITATSFTNTYHWGNFRGDANLMMDRYFDAFVYVANWGSHWLSFRFPKGVLDVTASQPYCDGEFMSLRVGGNSVVLEDQMMKLSSTQMDYSTASQIYKKALSLIRMAVSAPR